MLAGRDHRPTAQLPPKERGAQAEGVLLTFIFCPCPSVAADALHWRKWDLTQGKMNLHKPNKTYSLGGFAYLESSSN